MYVSFCVFCLIVLFWALLCVNVYWTAATRIGAMFDVP